jgi:hypothetical protein
MTNSFISIKELEPELFDLCDVQVNNSIYKQCRYLKHNDGSTAWITKTSSTVPSKHVSHWRLNSLHSDELTKEWLNSLKNLSEYPDDFNKDDWPTITLPHKFEV